MLSDYTGPGSHSIPYALTPEEIQIFLGRHGQEPALQSYMQTLDPPYGIIVQEGPTPSEFLVWHDQSHMAGDIDGLHVIDVTFMPIATAVKLGPFESPDGGVGQTLAEIMAKIAELLKQVKPTIDLGLIAVILIAGFFLVREVRR